MTSLDSITSQIAICQKCRLSQTRIKAVPGNGNHQSEILFIGEGPGGNEDKQGLPFVGAAGKYLEQLLSSINLTRDQVFVTNIVKCRPPGNRDPLPDEITTCTPYLNAQLEIMKPLLIVTLGRHAMNYFMPNLRISMDHGQAKRYKGQVYLPLYHPAAGLYNPATRTDIEKDFLKIPIILKKIKAQTKPNPDTNNQSKLL